MGLSSNVLWHQTKKEGLMSILRTKKLFFSYSLENIISSPNISGIAIPMVSLCDLPLVEIGAGKWPYGNYAIGLSRDWGIRNGFTPVCYCHKESSLYLNLLKNLLDAIHAKDKLSTEKAVFPFYYMKFVEGSLERRNYRRYRFYDEKEIRLIPKKEDIPNNKFLLKDNQYEEYKEKNGNSFLGSYGVNFSYEDVKFIVVESEKNRGEVIRFFKRHQVDDSHITILTKNQILEDIIGINHNKTLITPIPLLGQKSVEELALELEKE